MLWSTWTFCVLLFYTLDAFLFVLCSVHTCIMDELLICHVQDMCMCLCFAFNQQLWACFLLDMCLCCVMFCFSFFFFFKAGIMEFNSAAIAINMDANIELQQTTTPLMKLFMSYIVIDMNLLLMFFYVLWNLAIGVLCNYLCLIRLYVLGLLHLTWEDARMWDTIFFFLLLLIYEKVRQYVGLVNHIA